MGLKNGGHIAVTSTLVRVKVPALKAGLRLSKPIKLLCEIDFRSYSAAHIYKIP